MEEFNAHYNKLPAFIKAELKWYVGSIQGLSLVQVTSRHIAAADYWLTKKKAGFKPVKQLEKLAPAGALEKQHMDSFNARLEKMKKTPYSNNAEITALIQKLTKESIRYLTAFKSSLHSILTRAQAAEQQQAQRKTAKAARLLAEKAAQQLAQRQAEEAERQIAKRQAEEVAVSALRTPVTNAAIQQLLKHAEAALIEAGKAPEAQSVAPAILVLPDTKAVGAAIDCLLQAADTKIRTATDEFWLETGSQTGIPRLEAFGAMLHAFKRNGVDTRLIAEAVIQH
jgi:hypothetical protein